MIKEVTLSEKQEIDKKMFESLNPKYLKIYQPDLHLIALQAASSIKSEDVNELLSNADKIERWLNKTV
jgi:hypothetical protein